MIEFVSSDDQREVVDVVLKACRGRGADAPALLDDLHAHGLLDFESFGESDDFPADIWASVIYATALDAARGGEIPPVPLYLLPLLHAWQSPACQELSREFAAGQFFGAAAPRIGARNVSASRSSDGELVCSGTIRSWLPATGAARVVLPVSVVDDARTCLVSIALDDPAIRVLPDARPGVRDGCWREIHLDAARVPQRNVLGTIDAASSGGANADALAAAVLGAAVALTAAHRAVLEKTIQHTMTRIQFGHALAEFQSVQHDLAQLDLEHDMSVLTVQALASAVRDHQPGARELASIAKSISGTHALTATEKAIQLHGGIGFTAEAGLHHHLLAVRDCNAMLGSPAWHQSWLGAKLVGQPAGATA